MQPVLFRIRKFLPTVIEKVLTKHLIATCFPRPIEFHGAIQLGRTTIAVAAKELPAAVSDPRIQLALTLLRENSFSPRVRVMEIAATLHITSSHLRHLFKKEVGLAPTQYVKTLRLQKARELFETTFLSIKEVMVAVGFADPSHFVRTYKEQHGETPSQTRAAALKRKTPSTRPARNFRQ
jgi:transcriptional regulator GlxA family with amidase domain